MPEFIRTFSPDELERFRRIERSVIKLKAVLDWLYFLNECQIFGVNPKLVKLNRTFSVNVPVSTSEFAKKALLENIINARLQRKELQRFIDDNQNLLVVNLMKVAYVPPITSMVFFWRSIEELMVSCLNKLRRL